MDNTTKIEVYKPASKESNTKNGVVYEPENKDIKLRSNSFDKYIIVGDPSSNKIDILLEELEKIKNEEPSKKEDISQSHNIDEKSERTIKIPQFLNQRKLSFFGSFINHDDVQSELSLTYNSINLIRVNCELNFETNFVYESTSIEYTNGTFYSEVKLKLEYCRIICSSLSEKHKTINNKEIIFNPVLCLDFNQVTAKVFVNKSKKEFKIMVLGCKEVFKFRAKSEAVLESFLIYLNFYISISKGDKQNLLGVSLRPNFYKVTS